MPRRKAWRALYVGSTAHPDDRMDVHAGNGWKYVMFAWSTTSKARAGRMERLLCESLMSSRRLPEVVNRRWYGEGLRDDEARYWVYVLAR